MMEKTHMHQHNSMRDSISEGFNGSVDERNKSNREENMVNEVEVVPLTDMMKDEFSTLRIKKLIACVLAEFKTQNENFKLSEEEI